MNAKNVYIFIIFTLSKKKIVNIYKKNYNLNSHQNIEEKFKKKFLIYIKKNLQIIKE